MLEQYVEPATTVDAAMRAYSGSATGWEKASDYVYAQPCPQGRPDQVVVDTALRRRSVHPLPPTFAAQMLHYQYRSYMGLFPQLQCAWLTVDSNLFLWSYDLADPAAPSRPSDLYVYEGIHQVIVSVAVVSPRPGVFVDSVKWLVAVATSADVTLLGVEFSPAGEINLVPTHISIATDNILMLKIVSTPDGRIFMAGADGSLHEFVYQSNPRSGFFDLLSGRPVKRARKVVHSKSSLVDYFPSYLKTIFAKRDELVDIVADASRAALYTLSQSGSLTVYNIQNPTSTIHVCTVNVAHESRNLVSFSAPAGEREYVSLHVVPASCLVSVHVIVVTSFGERIYFSAAASASSSAQSASRMRNDFAATRPRTLTCVGCRPSPDRTISRSTRPCVHNAWCERGAAVFADLRPANVDRLIVVHPDSQLATALSEPRGSRPGTVRSKEVVMEVLLDEVSGAQSGGGGERMSTPFGSRPEMDGGGGDAQAPENRTFAIADASAGDPADRNLSMDPVPFDPPGSFLVLSATALYVYERIPPVVRLTEILEAGGGAASDIASFFERHGTAEAFAMCLEIAVTSPTLQRAAASVLYTYGEGGSGDKGDGRSGGSSGRRSEADSPYTYSEGKHRGGNVADSYFDIGRPSLQVTPQSRLSGAHDGVSLYIAKIVYPIWNEYLTSERNPDGFQALVAPREVLVRVRDQLLHIVSFLDSYPADAMFRDSGSFESNRIERRDHSGARNRLSLLRPNDMPRQHDQDRMNVDSRGRYTTRENMESLRRRSSSIAALKKLAGRVVEALAFLLILEDHQLHRLAVSLSKENRALLANIRFCEFVAGDEGMALSAALVEAIFGGYSDGMEALSRVGGVLRERCPGYFQASDVELHRGLALLREAAQLVSGIQEERRASEEIASGGWSGDTDRAASALIAAQNYAATAAKVLKSVPDRIFDVDAVCQEFEAAQAVPSMIDVALTVGKLEESRGKHERADVAYHAILRAIGPFVNIGNTAEGINEENCLVDYERLRESAMQVALNAESETFLRKLYEFLLGSKAGEEVILNSSGISLEKYLEETKRLDILWRYCAQHGRYFEAAGVLLNLSEAGDDTSLIDRVNFLSCAMHNAKTAVVKGDSRAGALLAEISDFLDVAKVQLRVREELVRRHAKSREVEIALEELDNSVFGLSTLFNNYARPFNLYEASLEAFRCGVNVGELYFVGRNGVQ
ncbi:unnamed protein product [Chondrus crispus]|uniref:Nucleoporin Nup133/Nup155-like N-terminal domain-containing protein n=1 Tax=Chondrus crispus TaxID=2769 RepID=R7QG45_CHOCR|nr:unnamed protein product [Chondrus crispus]CDF37472.1 unnamed protein product [Chondrus crispus]|eukprot:XP_005717291.1 unnamed protein product [Chondrus crispus]